MTVEEAFLEQCLDRPDDLALRLVYADWLEEQGDPRAEFLRLTVTLAEPSVANEKRPALAARGYVLRQTLSWGWLMRVDRSCAEEAGQEAAFHDLLGEEPTLRPVFLAIDSERDPSPTLLARLRQSVPVVQPVSERAPGADDGYDHPLLVVSGLTWINGRKCEVQVADIVGPLMAQGLSYLIEWKDGHWAVTERTPTWIS